MKKIRKLALDEVRLGSKYEITCPSGSCSWGTIEVLEATDYVYLFGCYIFNTRKEALVFKTGEAIYMYTDLRRHSRQSLLLLHARLARYYRDYVSNPEDTNIMIA